MSTRNEAEQVMECPLDGIDGDVLRDTLPMGEHKAVEQAIDGIKDQRKARGGKKPSTVLDDIYTKCKAAISPDWEPPKSKVASAAKAKQDG